MGQMAAFRYCSNKILGKFHTDKINRSMFHPYSSRLFVRTAAIATATKAKKKSWEKKHILLFTFTTIVVGSHNDASFGKFYGNIMCAQHNELNSTGHIFNSIKLHSTWFNWIEKLMKWIPWRIDDRSGGCTGCGGQVLSSVCVCVRTNVHTSISLNAFCWQRSVQSLIQVAFPHFVTLRTVCGKRVSVWTWHRKYSTKCIDSQAFDRKYTN